MSKLQVVGFTTLQVVGFTIQYHTNTLLYLFILVISHNNTI